MRSKSVLILLAVLLAFCSELALAQDVSNATSSSMAANITNTTNVTAPAVTSEPASRYTQLSNATPASIEVLGRTLASGYRDVTKVADTQKVFSRDPGATTPSVKVAITDANAKDKWIEIINQAVGSWDLTGWTLVSAGNVTFTFPDFTLNMGSSVKVREGNGAGDDANLYTNSTSPLWTGNQIALVNPEGTTISKFNISSSYQPAAWKDPLAARIQY